MFQNQQIINEAKKALEEKKDYFESGEDLVFFVKKEKDYINKPGQMPSYFDFEGERYVVFVKNDK